MAESDVYHMGPTDFDPSDSSDDELLDSSGVDLIDFQDDQPPPSRRPPAIDTKWSDSMDRGAEIDDVHAAEAPVYPVQSLSHSQQTPAPKALATPSTEETPAFIRQYARDMIKIADSNLATSPRHIVPPNTLAGVRETTNMNGKSAKLATTSSHNDHSFYGANASPLDSTFVSIRDLNDDDDVPSINNEESFTKYDGMHPTERTSLLGNMSWRGGFFPQVEKEDAKERRKIMRDQRGWVMGWLWSVKSLLAEVWDSNETNGRRVSWDNHPIGAEPVRSSQHSRRKPVFAMVLTGVLCFHMILCAFHDLFVRYVSYRNEDEVGVSWDGEGTYSPPYWLSFEGRVLNPFIGPGSRTLTAFGGLVPGPVLSKGQWWRVILAFVESSSTMEMLLHCYVLKFVVGGSLMGLESKRGTFTVLLFYVVAAIVGSIWSMAVDQERLVTSSHLGITGLLAAIIVEQYWFPSATKNEDETSHSRSHNDLGGSHNVISSTSNEQFSFQPIQTKKERNMPINPIFLLAMEIILSWWAPYQSLAGSITAAVMGLALSLVAFVGKSSDTSGLNNHDLMFRETPPPPTSSVPWRDDDESADSSFCSGRQPFNTPLMRKSILHDEDDDEQHGPKSLLRKRKSIGSETKNTPARYISVHSNKHNHTSIPAIWRVVGILLTIVFTLIPAALLAASGGPSYETTRSSILGCKPMRIVYRIEDDNDTFQCAGGCVPLSRTKVAKKKESMRDGRCDAIGFRCIDSFGAMILRQYELDVGLYVVPQSDGSCAYVDDDANNQAAEANNQAAEANNQAA